MYQAVVSEFRKLLTIRSTYVIIAFCLVLLAFFAFYIEGFRQIANVTDPGLLAREVTSAAMALGLLISLIGVLLVTHEYRYNFIMYTLTSSRSRLTTLAAKIIAVSTVSILLTLLFCTLSPILTYLGLQARGLDIVPQSLPYVDLLWRTVFYGWGYSMIALLIATLVRSQVGSIAVLLLFPATVETLLSLLLKQNAVYQPFSALNGVIQATTLSHAQAAWVVTLYLIGGWAIASYLFVKRDAN